MIEIARALMGGIHLDPASSEEFNGFVRALMIYTEQSNGLAPESEWAGNVFCNPPGGLVNEFWRKLCTCFAAGQVDKAFWIGFSVEQLCTLAGETNHPMDFSTCILRKRLSFNQQIDRPITRVCQDPNNPEYPITIVTHKDPATGKEVQTIHEILGWQPPEIITGNSPSHGNYVTALGCDPAEFERLLSPYGKIYHGHLSKTPIVSP
jgi:hypothetical protein